MGLIVKKDFRSGLAVDNVYCRIENVYGSKQSVITTVKFYVSKNFADSDKDAIGEQQYVFVPSVADDATNFIKQGYEYLKTLPEFSDAIDA